MRPIQVYHHLMMRMVSVRTVASIHQSLDPRGLKAENNGASDDLRVLVAHWNKRTKMFRVVKAEAENT